MRYWSNRLINKKYDCIEFRLGYPKNNDKYRIFKRKYRGFVVKSRNEVKDIATQAEIEFLDSKFFKESAFFLIDCTGGICRYGICISKSKSRI